MRYPDGQIAKVGDQVELWPGNDGVVVCSLDTKEFTDDYPRRDWEYLKQGVLVVSETAGLMHLQRADPEMRLRKRQADVLSASA